MIGDAIKHFCGLFGITSKEGVKEYGVFMIVMNMEDEGDKYCHIKLLLRQSMTLPIRYSG